MLELHHNLATELVMKLYDLTIVTFLKIWPIWTITIH